MGVGGGRKQLELGSCSLAIMKSVALKRGQTTSQGLV